MRNEKQVVVTDGETFKQISIESRITTVFKINNHTDTQIENLLRRHGHVGVLINNLATCKDPKLQAQCMKNRQDFEAELTLNRPTGATARWTPLEELEIIVAVIVDTRKIPTKLQQAFNALNQFQAVST